MNAPVVELRERGLKNLSTYIWYGVLKKCILKGKIEVFPVKTKMVFDSGVQI